MPTMRDRLWLWGHEAGSHNAFYHLPRASRMTPAEAAWYMGTPNLLMVCFGGQPAPENYDLHARSFTPLRQVVWSIIGDASSTRNNTEPDLDAVLALAEEFPNLTGAIMDDVFHQPNTEGRICRASISQLEEFRARLHAAPRPLDLWTVLYRHDLELPAVAEYLAPCDVVTFWTWEPAELQHLETNFARVEALAPAQRKMLGLYMFDYGKPGEITLDAMEHQCTVGLRLLQEGRVDGLIFLATCICDLEFPAVVWTRQWIAEHGEIVVG